ncbi:MAG: DUF389 domain-containing protein [Actinobacteria bacterium]|nr:DUF389 domain-containing protein [Actinomycetota bacterium]
MNTSQDGAHGPDSEKIARDVADAEAGMRLDSGDFPALDLVPNPAVLKGALLMLAGLFTLLFPDVSEPIIRLAAGAGLIVYAALDVWANIRRKKERSYTAILLDLLAVVIGLAILLPDQTIDLIVTLLGAYLILRGIAAVLRLLFRRSKHVVIDLIAAGTQTALGIMMVVLPSAVLQAFLGGLAIAAVAAGGMMIAYAWQQHSSTSVDVNVITLSKISQTWLKSRDLGDERRDEIAEDLYFEPPGRVNKLAAWWVMLGLSVVIGTYGILQNSTAVVIGAMLIAPLMTPIVGAAGAIVNGRKTRLVHSLLLVWAGVGAAILIAVIIGKWSPSTIPFDINTQITSRTSPNVLDMAIALAAGAAGAFAIINRRLASGLAGVAVAVALVPPLGVVGLTLEVGDYSSAWGAFLLFLTNLVSILLSATGVFVLAGWVSVDRLRSQAVSIAMTTGTVLAAAMVILLPLLFTSQGLVNASLQRSAASDVTTEWFDQNAPQLSVNRVAVSDGTVRISVAGPEQVPNPESLAAELSQALGEPVDVSISLIPTELIDYSQEDDSVTRTSAIEGTVTSSPTSDPTGSPASPSASPTANPTGSPTGSPTASPTASSATASSPSSSRTRLPNSPPTGSTSTP